MSGIASSLLSAAREFVRNLAVTFALPAIDLLRWLGRVELPRPAPPVSRPLTENPAGRSLTAVGLRVLRRAAGRPLGADQPILKELSDLSKGDAPIIVGPWLSEVGFELLYWVPFVNWAVTEFGLAPERLHIVSRGGVASWYGQPGARYTEIFEAIPPHDFAALNRRRIEISGHQKHMARGEIDMEILRRSGALEGRAPRYLHPALMYQALIPIWSRRGAPALAARFADYRPIVPPSGLPLPELPARYTAAKFYYSDAFPDTETNRGKVWRIVERLLAKGPVVLLNSPRDIDDHGDMHAGLPDGLYILEATRPEDNLALQSRVVAGADRFVGTYGGFAYLAPFMGVPGYSVYSEIGAVMPVHLDTAVRAFRALQCGSAEDAMPAGATGRLPQARFSAMHVDTLCGLID